MNTYYLALFLLLGVMLPLVVYERSRSYINSSFGISKVLCISIGLALMLAGQKSYWSFLGSIIPTLLLVYFVSYRIEGKKVTSTAELIGKAYGDSARVFFGLVFFLLAFLLLEEQVATLFTILENCYQNGIILFSLLGVYIIAVLAFASFEVIVWHQVVLLICFMLFCLIGYDSSGNVNIYQGMLAKFRMISGGGFTRSGWSSMLLATPFQTQILWLFQEKKYSRRTYRISIGFMIYIIMINLASFTYLPRLTAFVVTSSLQNIIRSIPGFYLASFCYQIFTIIPLVYFGSRFLINDVINPLRKENEQETRRTSLRFFTVFLMATTVFCLTYVVRGGLPLTGIVSDFLLLSFQVPFIAAVVNLEMGKRELYSSVAASSIIYCTFAFFSVRWPWLPIISGLIASGIALVAAHYYRNKNFLFKKRSYKEKKALDGRYITMKKIKSFLLSPLRIIPSLWDNVDYYGAPYNTGSCFLAFSFLAVPTIFKQVIVYEGVFQILAGLCAAGFFLAFFLFLYPCWPNWIAQFFPLYWHFTLVYSLSFFPIFSYCLLGFPPFWLVVIALSTLMLARFLCGKNFLPLHIVGTVTALLLFSYIVFPSTSFSEILLHNKAPFLILLKTYAASLLLGCIFIDNHQYSLDYTKKALNHLSQEFLHLNTNLVGMAKTPASIIKMLLDSKMEEARSKGEGNVIFEIDRETYNLIREHIEHMLQFTSIGTQVVRRRSRYFAPVKEKEFSEYSAFNCVESAIDIFKKIDTSYNSAPEIIVEKDFYFYGSNEHFEQVILNLIACTFAHCGQDVKKEIIIKERKIVYQYHGKVIPVKELPYLFTYLLYSQKSTGYYKEVGALAYVKRVMNAFGGNIACSCHVDKAAEKNYTQFTLYFPRYSKSAK